MNGVRDEIRAIFDRKEVLYARSVGVVEKLGLMEGAVREALGKLGRDAGEQRRLGEGVVDALTRKCWKARWVRSASQEVEMRRFVGFVVERVGRLRGCMGEMEGLLRELEGVIAESERC